MQKNLHFYGLDSLRAIAALAVVVSHIEYYKKTAGLENVFDTVNFFKNAGNTGVILFFVLSGFLITYLLLYEREKTSAVNVRYFYIRRLLRIWPLYFFITALAFILAPLLAGNGNYYPPAGEEYKPLASLLMYVFFIPNLAFLIKMGAPMALHLWTIGVEEQFYLSVPWLIKKVKKHLIYYLFAIYLIFTLLPVVCYVINMTVVGSDTTYTFFRITGEFFQYGRFFSIALGGIFAYICFFQVKSLLKIIYNKYFELTVFVIGMIMWGGGIYIPLVNDHVYSLIFGIIILNIATNPNRKIRFQFQISEYLGKISYGIYMYHWLAIIFTAYLIRNIFPYIWVSNSFVFNVLLYSTSIVLLIGAASLSYFLVEKRILKLKKGFSVFQHK